MSSAAVHQLLGEIESPRPLRATEEKCTFTGWCLLAGEPQPPPVRLITAAGVLAMSVRTDRTDVHKRFPTQPAAVRSGFIIEGRLPSGVHLAFFEAQLPDGTWQVLKTLSLVIKPRPFTAVLDEPIAVGVLRDRVKVGGWVFHPGEALKELVLRYGHQEIRCTLTRPRADVIARFSEMDRAYLAGFESSDFLVAGHGLVRLRGRFASGRIAVAQSHAMFSVATDENIGPEIDLTAMRTALPGYDCRFEDPPATKTATPLNLLFVLHGDFTSNSALQVCSLANELAASGHDCSIAVPRDRGTSTYQQQPRFTPLIHAEAIAQGGGFKNRKGPDIIHAWTTREAVRLTTEKIQQRHGGRIVIQLEDNEQEILAQTLQRPWSELRSLPVSELDLLVPPEFAHPVRSANFLAAAEAVTLIVDSLREFVPKGKPCATLWPAADSRYYYPHPIPAEFRTALQFPPDTTILFYHGNAHAANASEMRALYAAVLTLNRTGHSTRLIRAGTDQIDFLGPLARDVQPWILSLGAIHTHRHLPPLMALADIFVQPGIPDRFNDYRFPSKLPEFFSIGRPVVLPRTNLGPHLRHGIDAYVLDRADASGIASAVVELRQDRALYDRLSQGAIAYAEKKFSWRRTAETLAKFYSTLTA